MKGGHVFGSTDEKGAEPTSESFSPGDVGGTFLQLMGIDHHKEYHTPDGRPVLIVRDGQPIQVFLHGALISHIEKFHLQVKKN